MLKRTKAKKSVDHQTTIDQLQEKYQRAVADYANLEKRTQQLKLEFITSANRQLLTDLLPILDNLERAATHIDDAGLSLVLTGFHQLLEDQGVTAIKPTGEAFDPATMECIETVSGQPNQVVAVIQPGYKYRESLLRPAKVTVGSAANPDSPIEKN